MSAGETQHLSTSYTKFLLENGSEHLVAQIVMNMQLAERPEIMGRSPREVSFPGLHPRQTQPACHTCSGSFHFHLGRNRVRIPVSCLLVPGMDGISSCCVKHLDVVLRLLSYVFIEDRKLSILRG